MKIFNFKSLATKLILPVVLISAIILGAFMVYDLNQQSMDAIRELNGKGNATIDLLETAARNPLWDYSEDNLMQLGDAIAMDRETAIVAFYDANYNLMYMVDKMGEEAYDDQYLRHYPQEMNGTIFAKEVFVGDETAGYIELVLTDFYIQEEMQAVMMESFMRNGILLLLLIILITIVTRFVVKSVNKLSEATEIIASGDLTTRIEMKNRDEVGKLAEKFNSMTDNLYNLVSTFNTTAHNLAASSEEMAASVDNSISVVKDITVSTEDIVSMTKNQSSDIVLIDQSVNDMTTYFVDLAENVDGVTKVSENAINIAKDGETAVQETIHTVETINTIVKDAQDMINGLAEKSDTINSFVGTINQITEQTKMLSLNASIEAARSGEAGRGFAVVAEEIKKLADQSNEMTIQISESIDEIQAAIKEAVVHMDSAPKAIADSQEKVKLTVDALSKIIGSTEDTANMLRVVKDNTHEQIEHSKEVASSVGNIATSSKTSVDESEKILVRVIEHEKIVGDISDAATDLAKLAEELIEVSTSFKI